MPVQAGVFLFVRLSLQIDINKYANLGQQNQGHTHSKPAMQCFVAKNMHAQQRTRSTPDQGHKKQLFFRNSSFIESGPALVQTENTKRNGIN